MSKVEIKLLSDEPPINNNYIRISLHSKDLGGILRG